MIEFEAKPIYVQTKGKTALAYREKELVGHGIKSHAKGFGSPVGKLKGINLAIEDMSPRDLKAYNVYEGENTELEFEGGITINGEIITGTRNPQGKIILISFKNCTVKYFDQVLFQPEWGRYDMAVGKEIVSAFAGPADHHSFNLITHKISSKTIKTQKTEKRRELEDLYESVRNFREGKNTKYGIQAVFDILKKDHQKDWLLATEIYELALEHDLKLAKITKDYLEKIQDKRPEIAHLIEDGISMAKAKLVTKT